MGRGSLTLNNVALTADQRHSQFRNVMLSVIEIKRIGLFTLGQYANGASNADIDAFTNAFTDYAVVVYESRLRKYKGLTLTVTGSIQRATDDVVVDAHVVNLNTASNAP